MKPLAKAAVLASTLVLITGCGGTSTSTTRTDSGKSSPAPSPSVSAAALTADVQLALKQGPAGRQLILSAVVAAEPDATPAQIAAAIDQFDVDWNARAVRAAKSILHGTTGTTRWLLAHALTGKTGFTKSQSAYALKHVTVDWNAQAIMGFEHILKTGDGWSRAALIRHVISVDHYTAALANYAADHAHVDWNAQAVKAAKQYAVDNRAGLLRKLSSHSFTPAEAAYAADELGYYTVSQQNAIRAAKSYLQMQGFSRQGLIEQLSSSYGSGFSVADATFAVDHIRVDWNAQAVKAARSYLQMQGFSRQGLIEQLSSSYGSGFTLAQATYAADHVGL